MRFLLLRVLLAATLLAPALARAELIHYKGTRRDTYTGEGHGLTVNPKVILIVDHDTAQVARLEYATVFGSKYYSTAKWTNAHFVQVSGTRGSYTVIARAATQCELDSGATGEGVYCKGANAALTINTNSTVAFPKILSARGIGLGYSSTSGQPILDEGSFQLVFDSPGTLASNRAGESLDAAFARITAYIESLGYRP